MRGALGWVQAGCRCLHRARARARARLQSFCWSPSLILLHIMQPLLLEVIFSDVSSSLGPNRYLCLFGSTDGNEQEILIPRFGHADSGEGLLQFVLIFSLMP